MATSFGLTDILYFCLKHWMNKFSGLSVPKSKFVSGVVVVVAADNASSKLFVASFNSSFSLAISLSLLISISVRPDLVEEVLQQFYLCTGNINLRYLEK